MNFEPTHLDSHMGTLFASPAFLERYVAVGAEDIIPVMLPGGHNTLLLEQMQNETIAELKRQSKHQTGGRTGIAHCYASSSPGRKSQTQRKYWLFINRLYT